jgi:membrane-associated phospholipid phosphatase
MQTPRPNLSHSSKCRKVGLALLVLLLASGLQAQTQEPTLGGALAGPSDAPDIHRAAFHLPDAPSSSQEVQGDSFGSKIGRGVIVIGKDELTFIKAPFNPKNLKWDALFVAAVAPLIATDEHVAHATNPAWYGTSGTLSNALLATDAGTAGAIFVTGLITDNTHAKDTGVAAARASIDSVIMYTAMKVIFQRERPFSGGAEGKFFSGNWSEGSFPSGHSLFDWTIASVIAHEYPKWEVAAAMYSLALFGSGSRVTAGVHFPSDVVVGSTFGYLIGRYVAKQSNHLPGDAPARPRSKMLRVEDAVVSHVSLGVQ